MIIDFVFLSPSSPLMYFSLISLAFVCDRENWSNQQHGNNVLVYALHGIEWGEVIEEQNWLGLNENNKIKN